MRPNRSRMAYHVVPLGAALILLTAGVFVACGNATDTVRFRYDNRTDSTLCTYPSPQDAAAGKCQEPATPHATTRFGSGCGYGTSSAVRTHPVTMILTVKDSGQQIYSRTASCGEWNDSGATLVIEQRGDAFVVKDSLADSAPRR